MLVGLIFKPLLNASKRHVPIIFGNILTETEGRERAKGKRRKEKKQMTQFDPLCLLHLYNQGDKSHYSSIWELQFVNTMLTYQSDSPWGTFLWLRFADDYTPTRPGYTAQMPPTVFYDSAALSGLQVCFKTLMAVHLHGHADVTNNLISNQSEHVGNSQTHDQSILVIRFLGGQWSSTSLCESRYSNKSENGLQRFLCFYLRLLIQNTGSEKLLYSKLMVE